MAQRILVVDDEAQIRQMLRFALEREGYAVDEAADVPAARLALAERRPDLVLLDWMLPGTSGVDFARELRASEDWRDLPIIMVTARGEQEDMVRGLELGCDDYVAKPFGMPALLARLRAVLRRAAPQSAERIRVGELEIDAAAHRVTVGGSPLRLGPTEFRLLHFLASHPDRVFSREQLLNRVWGHGVYIEERTVDVHVRRLRKALEPSGQDRLIQTVRGAGYRLSEAAE